MNEDVSIGQDDERISVFIERLGSSLVEIGFPRVASRVFVALLTSDEGLTSAELSHRLSVSPAAISGAVRWLIQLNLVSRERDPGSRRDRYVPHEDTWQEATIRKDQSMGRWIPLLKEAINAVGRETPAGDRLAETLAFVQFVNEETPALLERWHTRRAALRRERLPFRYR